MTGADRRRVGVLALQGGFAAHARALTAAAAGSDLDVEVVLVRRPEQLDGLDGLVLPGGESTTLLKLLALDGLDEAIVRFVTEGRSVLATCAGVILLAREVRHPAQASLGLLDVVAQRNGYGRQVDSFTAPLRVGGELGAEGGPLPGVFIRAPRLLEVGADVEVLARHAGDPVLVRQGQVLAATFHPELTGDLRLSAAFLRLAVRTAVARA